MKIAELDLSPSIPTRSRCWTTSKLPEPAASPHIVGPLRRQDRDLRRPMWDILARYFWDPATQKLSADASWAVKPLVEGGARP